MGNTRYKNIVEFQVTGAYGLFSDPVMRMGGEKCSYQIPTYEALKGILSSVYWKPSLSERASATLKGEKNREKYAAIACDTWLDVRAFGQVFAFGDANSVSVGVRGPVSIHQAISVSPVEIESLQITKSVNGEKGEKGAGKSSDTMGMKHFVRFGVYVVKGSINVQSAEKTGFSYEDAQVVKECIRTLFENDESSARPAGSMEVRKLYWFEHNSKHGQYSTATVHRSVKIAPKDPNGFAECFEDYEITLEHLEGLEPEVLDGV